MSSERALARWVTAAAAAVSAALVLIPPAAFFFFSHERLAGAIEAEVEITSHLVSQVVSSNPELWEYEATRLADTLSRRPRRGDAEARRIRNAAGAVVAESADPLPRPWILRSAPLLDAGQEVGTVEIARSLRPRLFAAGVLAILLLGPSALLYFLLRTLPIAALRAAEGELRRERDAAQKYLDVAGVAFVILDAAGRVSLVNRRGTDLLGRTEEDARGLDWIATFVVPDDRERFATLMTGSAPGEVVELEFSILRPAGDRRLVTGHATPLSDERGARAGLLLSGVDITHQRELEAQLRHAQKLRTVGQLAGGVAHDFNNILAAIKARAALLRADLVVGSPHRLDADEILSAADRAAALTRSLLTFSRREALAAEPVDVADLVRRSEGRLRRLLPEEIALATELPARPLPVLADPLQIGQVLGQLVTSARDAIRGPGRITLAVSATSLSTEDARRIGLDAPGAYARVAVTDSGTGLDAEARARLFEPFSSRDAGPAAGGSLGLAIAFGIVELHRGTMQVASELGQGTTVTFLLPIGGERAVDSAAPGGGARIS